MFSKSVSNGVVGVAAVGGLVSGAVMIGVVSLPQAQRVTFVKSLGMLFLVFLSLLSAVVAVGLFSEIFSPVTHIVGNDRMLATITATAFTLPLVLVLLKGVRKLFKY